MCLPAPGFVVGRPTAPRSSALAAFSVSGDAQASSASAPSATAHFAEGARVRLRGLVARPFLNSVAGTVLRWDDSVSRYAVQLDTQEAVKVRAVNLEACPNG